MNRRYLSTAIVLLGLATASCRAGGVAPSPSFHTVSCPADGAGPSPRVDSEASQEPVIPSPSAERSVHPDARSYAQEFGVSLDEATRRLNIQAQIDTSPLRAAVGDRWAGGWLEHDPEFRYVVRLTGADVDAFEMMTSGWPLPVDFITGASFTEADALAGQQRIDDVLHAAFPKMGLGWEPRAGAIVMNGPDAPSAEFLRELEALAGVPILYECTPAMEELGG